MALTEFEREVFEGLVTGENQEAVFLQEATLDEERVAVIVAVTSVGDSTYLTAPVAIMVDNALFDRLSPPEGALVVPNDGRSAEDLEADEALDNPESVTTGGE